MHSVRRIKAIMFKEVWQLARDKITFAMIVMIPLVQLVLFGYAINTDVRQLPVGWLDLSQTSASRQFLLDVQASQVVQLRQPLTDNQQGERLLQAGAISAMLLIPADFQRRLQERQHGDMRRPLAQWITDGADPISSGVINGLKQLPLPSRGHPVDMAVPSAALFEVVHWYNPERRSAVFIVPGLIAVILTMTMILFTSAAIVREREQGNLEFLINTPVRPLELMLGKILPYMVIGALQVLLILLLGHLLFAVPLPMQWTSLALATLLFILASLTLGLLISTRAQTQLQAMQLTVFILLPSILLSGFMFPFAAMPTAAQYLAELLPATHYVRLVRAIVLKDAHWTVLSSDLLALLIFTGIGLLLATLRFRKRLD